jgi:GNAT superfamily N-acetyltransferase
VAEHAEGRGIGSALLQAAADWSRDQGFDRLTLSVFAGNRRAQNVYERHGFRPETARYVKTL